MVKWLMVDGDGREATGKRWLSARVMFGVLVEG